MAALQIYDPRERRLVSAADRALSAVGAVRSVFRTARPPRDPGRILLLRLERIGDLLMALPAIASVRELAPDAAIDLVVGSWNEELARAVPGVTRVETLDAAWLARAADGMTLPALLRRARGWRPRHYDLAINFEPDIRSNLLTAAAGAAWSAGYASGGGGPLLDQALAYNPREHTTDNARRLVTEVFGRAPGTPSTLLRLPEQARRRATERLASAGPGPLVGIHVSGGRAVKQWDPQRFAEVAQQLAARYGATLVLTGSSGDRPLVQQLASRLEGRRAIDVSGEADLLTVAAILERLDLLITGDTGPMHLAHAVNTPIVAIFGPSDPVRYAPRGPRDRIVRVDLPCSPCNRIRRPPGRCVGHIPDCLTRIDVQPVLDAAVAVLDAHGAAGRARTTRA